VRSFYLQTYRKLVYRFSLEGETTVFVQTEEDLEAYSAAFPKIRVVLRPGQGQAAAQEAIRQHYPPGSRVVVLHDDVTRVVRLQDGSFRRFEDVRRLFRVVFELMERYGVTLGGLAPTTNAFFEAYTARKVSLCLRYVYDPLHFELIRQEPLQPRTTGKQDFERSIEHYRSCGGVLRVAGFSISTRRQPGASSLQEDERDCQTMMQLYPKEISHLQKHRGGYSSLILRSLPYRGPAVEAGSMSAGDCEQEAQELFFRLLGNFDVQPDPEAPGGRLLQLLQKLSWRPNRLRASVVPPEERVVCVSKRGSKTVKADVAVYSASYSEGEIFEASISALPEGCPTFDFVTINKNICCHPHRDSGNAGPSLILFLGKFEGGALLTEAGERFEEAGVFHAFDGSKLHWNEPVTGGCKYSVVYYNRASGKLRPHAPKVQSTRYQPDSSSALESLKTAVVGRRVRFDLLEPA
jgi:hypothetical protein